MTVVESGMPCACACKVGALHMCANAWRKAASALSAHESLPPQSLWGFACQPHAHSTCSWVLLDTGSLHNDSDVKGINAICRCA